MADDEILFLDDAEPFADLMKCCADLERRANRDAGVENDGGMAILEIRPRRL
jgi:hypothetical protein